MIAKFGNSCVSHVCLYLDKSFLSWGGGGI